MIVVVAVVVKVSEYESIFSPLSLSLFFSGLVTYCATYNICKRRISIRAIKIDTII
jgi:hypothetical protein